MCPIVRGKVTREQHKLAIKLLRRLEVQNLRLEPASKGRYRYYGWSESWSGINGTPPSPARRGVIGPKRSSST
jgi:hypothetical protein